MANADALADALSLRHAPTLGSARSQGSLRDRALSFDSPGSVSSPSLRLPSTPSLHKTPNDVPLECYLEDLPAEDEVVRKGLLSKLLSGRVRRWEQREVLLTGTRLCYSTLPGLDASRPRVTESINLLHIEKVCLSTIGGGQNMSVRARAGPCNTPVLWVLHLDNHDLRTCGHLRNAMCACTASNSCMRARASLRADPPPQNQNLCFFPPVVPPHPSLHPPADYPLPHVDAHMCVCVSVCVYTQTHPLPRTTTHQNSSPLVKTLAPRARWRALSPCLFLVFLSPCLFAHLPVSTCIPPAHVGPGSLLVRGWP